MRIRFAPLIFLMGLGLPCSTALAEPVHIQTGQSHGQGWVFAAHDACWVATAKHVVTGMGDVIITGPDSRQAQARASFLHPELDLAILEIEGALAQPCPASEFGDAGVQSALNDAFYEASDLSLLRREFLGQASGLTPIPVEIVGLLDGTPFVSVSPKQIERDSVLASDSGSAIVLQGAGLRSGRRPVAITSTIEFDSSGLAIVMAVRMDEVRGFYEQIRAQTALRPSALAMTLLGFEALTPDLACGPLNSLEPHTECGWIAEKRGLEPIELSVRTTTIENASLVQLSFASERSPRGVSISTRPSPDASWSAEVYCSNLSQASMIECGISQRDLTDLRLRFEGEAVELLSVHIQ